jgi:hypothetical protein
MTGIIEKLLHSLNETERSLRSQGYVVIFGGLTSTVVRLEPKAPRVYQHAELPSRAGWPFYPSRRHSVLIAVTKPSLHSVRGW